MSLRFEGRNLDIQAAFAHRVEPALGGQDAANVRKVIAEIVSEAKLTYGGITSVEIKSAQALVERCRKQLSDVNRKMQGEALSTDEGDVALHKHALARATAAAQLLTELRIAYRAQGANFLRNFVAGPK